MSMQGGLRADRGDTALRRLATLCLVSLRHVFVETQISFAESAVSLTSLCILIANTFLLHTIAHA